MDFVGSSSARSSEEERAFLQQRLGLFAKVAFFISALADIINLVAGQHDDLSSVGSLIDRSVTVAFAIMWLLCAFGTRSVRFLRIVESVSLFELSVGVSLIGRHLAASLVPEVLPESHPSADAINVVDLHTAMVVMLGGTIMFALRAAVVPSPPWLTLFVTGVVGLPYVLVPLFVAPTMGWSLSMRSGSPTPDATTTLAIWWAIVTITCVVISHVIYGLQRDIRRAKRLGQYTLEDQLGEGGMGTVHRASHAMLRRPTAVKLLPPDRIGEGSLERFEREVQLTATLTHPNTITIYDYGRTPDGVLYYAMELVEGPTLQDLVEAHGPQPPARVAHVLSHAAAALAEAHGAGLIHRDIKPANIMLCERGGEPDVVKVLDFGLVKEIRGGRDANLTQADALKGTPHYMSPEAIRDPDRVGGFSDVYALGAVGYFLITGATVFEGASVVEVCSHHLHTKPTPPSERLGAPVPEALETFLLECLDKDPERRPTCDLELASRLLSLDGVEPWSASNARAWWEAHGHEARLPARGESPLGELRTVPVELSDRVG